MGSPILMRQIKFYFYIMYDNWIKDRDPVQIQQTLSCLLGISTTIGELEGEDGISSRAKIFKIAKQDMLKISRLIYRWLHDR